jgi:NAD(P)-dependent dehydrogenase (short-subunit alcohol dehydrogenase family)
MNVEKFTSYQPPPDLLADRVILVTGASDGIGAALAEAVGRLGATAVLVARTVPELESVYDRIEAAGGPTPGIFVADLADPGGAQFGELFEAMHKTYGRLDGLIHNAGILGDRSPIEHYDVAAWQKVLHLNLTVPFFLTRSLFPLLRQSPDASVLFTSSGVGRAGRPYWGAYAVSKFGVEGLMQVLASEVEEATRIRVNAVNPGPTRTAMRRSAYPAEDPSGLKQPHEVLAPYLWLLGPDSRGVNGRSFDAQ